LEGQAQRLETAVTHAHAAGEKLEHFASRIETEQQQALTGFQSQLDDVLSLHRNELHRRSESLFEEINARIRQAFEETSGRTLESCREQIQSLVQPHISQAEEAVHRLAGGRSLLDAALTLQQDRIRTSADEAFAESMARFRENLGSVEQILQESAQSVSERSLSELESKASDLKRHTVDEMLKSAEWYEKKAQTQLQHLSDKATEQTGAHLREKAGEISSLFAGELNHSSQNFVHHTQTQLDEVVRDSFERARMLFAEAADTTEDAGGESAAGAMPDALLGVVRDGDIHPCIGIFHEKPVRSRFRYRFGQSSRPVVHFEEFIRTPPSTAALAADCDCLPGQTKTCEKCASSERSRDAEGHWHTQKTVRESGRVPRLRAKRPATCR
jgi:hypothetical protein